jgi:hypothetical protein
MKVIVPVMQAMPWAGETLDSSTDPQSPVYGIEACRLLTSTMNHLEPRCTATPLDPGINLCVCEYIYTHTHTHKYSECACLCVCVCVCVRVYN